jgi:hypothetical protein
MMIPDDLVGYVIGKRGRTIQGVQWRTGELFFGLTLPSPLTSVLTDRVCALARVVSLLQVLKFILSRSCAKCRSRAGRGPARTHGERLTICAGYGGTGCLWRGGGVDAATLHCGV